MRLFSVRAEDGEEVLFHSTLVPGSPEAFVLLAPAEELGAVTVQPAVTAEVGSHPSKIVFFKQLGELN